MTTMMNLPAIPEIGGDIDILLEVYTHRSLRVPNPYLQNEEYGDTDRLTDLGAVAFDFSVTSYLFSLRPNLSGIEIRNRASEIMSERNVDMWLGLYRMKEKLLVAPEARSILNDPAEMKIYFHTFLGAVQVRNGLPAVQDWISALIDWSLSAANGVGLNHVANVDVDDFSLDGVGNPA